MSAKFELAGGGIGVLPDPDDNPDGHERPHHDAGVRISIEVGNVGDGDGVATAAVEIDDVWVTDWQSGPLGTHRTATGYVSLGRLSEGPHTILVYVDPGSGQHDQQTTTVELP